jgi:mannose-6-phosphate isomerase-like protein (cupin superfamily)
MRLEGKVSKGWGSEEIWATNDRYCGKFMHFHLGGRSSMHFHEWKDETWYVLSGRFQVEVIDTCDASRRIHDLVPGDTWHNPPFQPHQLEALVDNSSISEVSTADSVEDNYRIIPGDSQNV